MKKINIGGIGRVSAVSLGLADIGTKYSEKDGYRMLDAYLDMGGNFLDTARVYSDWIPGETGRSERILGQWLAVSGNRDRVVLATKGAHPRLDSMNTPRLSAKDIVGDIELSMKTLRQDTIDLYYLHRDDRARPVEEILDTLEDCAKAGRIRRYACSNWRADRMLQAHACAMKHGFRGFAANQIHWNMASANCAGIPDETCETFNEEMYGAFVKTGMLAAAWSALAHGYFTKLHSGGEAAAACDGLYHTAGNVRIYRKAAQIVKDTGLTMTSVALNYVLLQPIPAVAIVGCRTMEQLKDVMTAAETSLPDHLLKELESSINGFAANHSN